MDKERKQQAQWQAHTIDEEQAIARQQASAGPTHEPVAESAGQRLQERQRCVELLRSWRDPVKLSAAIGPASAETVAAVQQALEAVEAELRAGDAA
jgi:hypothetical protein